MGLCDKNNKSGRKRVIKLMMIFSISMILLIALLIASFIFVVISEEKISYISIFLMTSV
jgi:uncharacterized protein YqhQ